MSYWESCEVPEIKGSRGCWSRVLADFDRSGDECWRRVFESRNRAENVARALRIAAGGMVERGDINPVRISRCGTNVYMIAEVVNSVGA